MENNKHHIDKFLRENMQKMPVEFNEKHWQDAERRLDEDDKKKRPFVLFFIIGVLLIGLGTAAVKTFSTNKKTNQQVVKKDNATNSNMQDESLYQQASYQENAQPTDGTEPNNESTDTGLENNSNNSNSDAVVSDYRSNDNSGSTSQQQKIGATDASRTAKVRKRTGANTSNSIKANQINNINTQTADISDKATASKKNRNRILAKTTSKKQVNTSAPASVKNDVTSAAKDIKRDAKSNTPQNAIDDAPATQVYAQTKRTPKNASVTIYKSPEELQKLNPRYVKGLENYKFTRSELSAKKQDSLRKASKTASAAPEAPKKVSPPADVFQQAPSSFFIMAGLAAAKGYTGSGDVGTDYGLSPNLGLGYQMNFSDRMSLYLSMYMSYISHLNIRETATNVSYSFDKDSTFVSVTRKNLLQLQIPLQLAYKIKPRHSVFGGLGINLGLNSVSLYEDSKQSSAKRQFGYMGGIRFMDLNASFGYEFGVTPKLSIGGFYQQGFFDMTKNNYFNNQQTDRNARGGINLRYKFLR